MILFMFIIDINIRLYNMNNIVLFGIVLCYINYDKILLMLFYFNIYYDVVLYYFVLYYNLYIYMREEVVC